jgi:tetratricopeptide (TPR) repeat protein
VLLLGRPAGTGDIPDHSPQVRIDILPRELVRQAVLIAARDGLGLATRDEVIDGTPVGEGAEDLGGVQVVSFIRDNRSREIIGRVVDGKLDPLFAHETPAGQGRNLNLVQLLESAEALSRESIPGVLKGLGLEGGPNALKPDDAGTLPPGVEGRLSSLDFAGLLEAVRQTHGAIRSDGETPARLGALARGYALLGVLSEFHWDPAHKVYKARGLLYSQRMAARDRVGPHGLWHRAFALALVGRHGDALADLEAAKPKAKGAPAPAWVEAVEAYARYDLKRLTGVKGPGEKLAALLRMFALERPTHSPVCLQAAMDVVGLEPACFRAYHTACTFPGLSSRHVTTLRGPQALEQAFPGGLGAIESLPAGIKREAGGEPGAGVTDVAAALVAAGAPASDGGEPSWAALGHFVSETQFVQTQTRMNFMRYDWSVPVDEYWRQVRPGVAGHRFRTYLESMAMAPGDAAQALGELAERVDLTGIETTELPMIRALIGTGKPRGREAWNVALAHEDEAATELTFSMSVFTNGARLTRARDILTVSPYQPYARAVLLEADWDSVKDRSAAWERESEGFPTVLAALAYHASSVKDYARAQTLLERYVKLSPDVWGYQSLADNFKDQGRTDRWRQTLEDFLADVEDLGLDHAKVQVQLADDYMARKQWDKARPYAEAAARSWAAWTMFCAARCAEGEGDWARAETWLRRTAERYPDAHLEVWYCFCKRTGHGDLGAARDFVQRYIDENAGRPGMVTDDYAGRFYWAEGRTDDARAAFTRSFERDGAFPSGLSLAALADDANDAARRDELLKGLTTDPKYQSTRSLPIYKMLAGTVLAPGGGKPLDGAALEREFKKLDNGQVGNNEFFIGWYLKNHGHREDAKAHLRRCAEAEGADRLYRLLAVEALKRIEGG